MPKIFFQALLILLSSYRPNKVLRLGLPKSGRVMTSFWFMFHDVALNVPRIGLLLMIVFLTAFTILVYKKAIFHTGNLDDIPGPFVARLTPFYRAWIFGSGNGVANVLKLHQTYGPVVRTGPRHVLVGDPAAVFAIYCSPCPKVGPCDVVDAPISSFQLTDVVQFL